MFQVLIYPSLDLTFKQKSVQLFGDGLFLTKPALEYYAANYAGNHNLKDWRVSPLFYSKYGKLPPAIVLTADCDPIRDDGQVYAKKIEQTGTLVAVKNVPGMIHAFMQLIETFPLQTAQSYQWLGEQIRAFWNKCPSEP